MKRCNHSQHQDLDGSIMTPWFTYVLSRQSTTAAEVQNSVAPGRWLFRFDNQNLIQSQLAAAVCPYFIEDDEDEMIDDVLLSCFNCMQRRWLVDGFECVGLPLNHPLVE
ncbi:hypothetical protein [Shewanella saliphila]|uniref:Uncharacterized protein n=1 Tax=Shewanella saliphila TaxID=2282698 RepID=A0ABQ2QAK8_9GAMM|nr:hypothetical protein [Shewanella saliphila]MCL1102822.1 hypothetical protein [Shewanella saliphila]GGP62220.1 hypothetical protein GCM10009409_30010 [Shewanella saliphila]